MKKFRLQAMKREFPWLSKFEDGSFDKEWTIDLESLESIQVHRIDKELLLSKPHESECTGSMVDIYSGTDYFIIFTVENEGLKAFGMHLVKPDYEFRSNYAHTDPYDTEGESIIEAYDTEGESIIEALDEVDSKNVIAIVAHEYGIETVDHQSQGHRMTIFKKAKNPDLIPIVLKAEKEKETALVRAEIAEVNGI